MQLKTTILALSAAGLALAAPLSMAADAAEWTIAGLSRTCDDADTSCVWTFAVDTAEEGVEPTPVANYTVNASDAAVASQAIGGPQVFGNFTVTSTWSGQFGDGEGFTTLSVIDFARNLIVYPAYKDTQLPNGEVVTPDQSYPVQNIPS
ncbi:hypothetical protein F4818DRAFT_435651 [Hypoxylon cercidicola]|nr:hypothetical protein F4818DRAFT_435651 [Hypoxylon cercidicola]